MSGGTTISETSLEFRSVAVVQDFASTSRSSDFGFSDSSFKTARGCSSVIIITLSSLRGISMAIETRLAKAISRKCIENETNHHGAAFKWLNAEFGADSGRSDSAVAATGRAACV